MELRNHPLMTYRGINNWPPVWTWRGGRENIKPQGEVGVLQDVFLSNVVPHSRIFLIVAHNEEEYMGCVLFTDYTFCGQIYQLLKAHCGNTIGEIGSLDVTALV
jgi:hypothetical protein